MDKSIAEMGKNSTTITLEPLLICTSCMMPLKLTLLREDVTDAGAVGVASSNFDDVVSVACLTGRNCG